MRTIIKWMPLGHLCGYVVLPPGHPWRGKETQELWGSSVHGGITFSGPMPEEGVEWAVGFDCGHYGDAPDLDHMDAEWAAYYKRNPFRVDLGGRVWTPEGVAEELKKLAAEVEAAASEAVSN